MFTYFMAFGWIGGKDVVNRCLEFESEPLAHASLVLPGIVPPQKWSQRASQQTGNIAFKTSVPNG